MRIYKLILHAKLAKDLSIKHLRLIKEFLPYLVEEGWIRFRTNDSISITEEGIEKARIFIK